MHHSLSPLRPTAWIIAMLFASVLVATGHAVADDDWRRTANGWERASSWTVSDEVNTARVAYHPPAVPHPLQIASLQVIGAFLALAVWPSRSISGPKKSVQLVRTASSGRTTTLETTSKGHCHATYAPHAARLSGRGAHA